MPVSQAELAESGVGGLVTDTLAHLVATTLKTIRDDNAGMRTFVFGAGASVHAGYPLAFDLDVYKRQGKSTARDNSAPGVQQIPTVTAPSRLASATAPST